jgi:ATP-dependent DNA helicase Rep
VLKRRKKGREYVQATPSRFIAEMKLGEGGGPKEDPREKLRRLREEMAAKAKARPATPSDD